MAHSSRQCSLEVRDQVLAFLLRNMTHIFEALSDLSSFGSELDGVSNQVH